jgi:glycosyltransferase involved in cell wall biosynthesis
LTGVLEVTWINGVRRLRQTSMEKYYRELARALGEAAPGELRLTVNEVEGIALPALRGLVNRYIIYSMKNVRLRPGLYHALDHANAHLMRLLPAGSYRILTVHDVEQLKSPWHRWRDLPAKLLGKPGMLAADRIIAVSGVTRDELAEVTGYPVERITVIHNGVNHRIYRPDGRAARMPRPYMLYVGSEKPRKNIPGLLRVLDGLRGEGLILVKAGRPGGEAHRRSTLSEMRRLGVESLVELRGHVEEEELAELYRGAVALVMPSLYEGFGIPVIEAMACGCPVVCSDIPAFREVAGEAALLFAPGDARGMAEAVLRLLHDQDFRRQLAARGTRRAGLFSWTRCAERHLEIYREAYGELSRGNKR